MPRLAGKDVGDIGFGLMGFTWRPNPCPEEQAFAAMREAIADGATLWNGGEFYGTPEHNSMTLLSRYFAKYPEDAAKVTVCFKGGVNMELLKPDGSPECIRRSIDNIVRQLGDTGGRCDIFEMARRDRNTPLEITFDFIKREYLDKGIISGISLSEVSAETIHEAVKLAKIDCVEVELSLWSTEVLTNGVAEACAKHNIPLIAYSPLGRGVLTGQIKSPADLDEGDIRRTFPRFQPEAFRINLELVAQVEALATKKGCTPAQLAMGWVLGLQRRPGMPTIIPIPGATTAKRVRENCTRVDLTDEEMAEIDVTLAKFEVAGGRYPEGSYMDT